MWGNISEVMGKALEKVQMLQSELENQMDAAVGVSADDSKLEQISTKNSLQEDS